jgi:hypothetical protein
MRTTAGTGSRVTERTTRRLQAAVAVALGVGALLAAGPGWAATHDDAIGPTVGTTVVDHFPGLSGTAAGVSSRCYRATHRVAIAVTINGVEFEVDHFPGISGGPAALQGAC